MVDDLAHHSNRGGRHLSIHYTKRQLEANMAPSVGAVQASLHRDGGKTAYTTVQVHRNRGYMTEDCLLERFCRDLKLSRIYEGTNEIQRLAIANEFPKE